eukprot:6190829-Pleurochrysis_carterae.AAC.1
MPGLSATQDASVPAAAQRSANQGGGGSLGSAAAQVQQAQAAALDADKGDNLGNIKATRWTARNHATRLVHVCMDLKQEFLRRNESLDRRSLDGASRNSFWELASKLWADPNYNPPLHRGGAPP